MQLGLLPLALLMLLVLVVVVMVVVVALLEGAVVGRQVGVAEEEQRTKGAHPLVPVEPQRRRRRATTTKKRGRECDALAVVVVLALLLLLLVVVVVEEKDVFAVAVAEDQGVAPCRVEAHHRRRPEKQTGQLRLTTSLPCSEQGECAARRVALRMR